MKQSIVLNINGDLYDVEIEPQRTLLEVLRENLGLTGTKKGCNQGECGACTVLINGKPVPSCSFLALEAQNKEILTIEGLAKDRNLHPVQQAFLKHGGFQCGFCTPGMIMSAKALLDENPHPTEDEIKKALTGNLCRCTGYTQIIQSVQAVGKES
ncbi:(2Fe-2S)-binding protein [Chloroflexota bacterium]